MWQAILGGLTAVAGAGANAILGGIESRRRARDLAAEERANRAWYDWERSRVGSESLGARRMLSRLAEREDERMSAAVGRDAVMGGRSAGRVASANAAGYGDAVAQLNANQESRLDAVGREHRANQRVIAKERRALSAQRLGQLSEGAQVLSSLGAQVAAADLGRGSGHKGSGGSGGSVPADSGFDPSANVYGVSAAGRERYPDAFKPSLWTV